MSHDVYATPEAPLLVGEQLPDHDLYVVSKSKFTVLFISTLGLYGVYWFYKNFRQQKDRHNLNIWPVPRAIFSIFFAHSLFRTIDEKLKSGGIEYSWNPGFMATLFVVASIINNISSNLANKSIGSPYMDILGFVLTFVIYYCLYTAQKAINISQGDAEGLINSRYTLANYIWILVGIVIWGLAAIGILMTTGVIEGY